MISVARGRKIETEDVGNFTYDKPSDGFLSHRKWIEDKAYVVLETDENDDKKLQSQLDSFRKVYASRVENDRQCKIWLSQHVFLPMREKLHIRKNASKKSWNEDSYLSLIIFRLDGSIEYSYRLNNGQISRCAVISVTADGEFIEAKTMY